MCLCRWTGELVGTGDAGGTGVYRGDGAAVLNS